MTFACLVSFIVFIIRYSLLRTFVRVYIYIYSPNYT